MALKYGIFPGNKIGEKDGIPISDRAVDGEYLARYHKMLLSNGVSGAKSDCFQVFAKEGMQLEIKPGDALYDGFFAYDDETNVVRVPDAELMIDRIDRVVLQLNLPERNFNFLVKPGVDGHKAELQRTADIRELCLAEVAVSAGVTQITQADITDTRLDRNVCGIVTGVIDQVDTTTLYNQIQADLTNFRAVTQEEYDTWTNEKKAAYDAWVVATQGQYNEFVRATQEEYNTWTAEKKAAYDKWVQDRDAAFMAWWDTIKGTLNGDTAGNLMNLINTHKADHENPHMVTKEQVGLGNVDNTADLAKPVSTATQAELDKKLDKTGGTVTGNLTLNGNLVANGTSNTRISTLGLTVDGDAEIYNASLHEDTRIYTSCVFGEAGSDGNYTSNTGSVRFDTKKTTFNSETIFNQPAVFNGTMIPKGGINATEGDVFFGRREQLPDIGPYWNGNLTVESHTAKFNCRYLNVESATAMTVRGSTNFTGALRKSGLDVPDMEIGTWIPNAANMTFSGTGSYVRVGKLVTVGYWGYATNNNTTIDSIIYIGGLPFIPNGFSVGSFGYYQGSCYLNPNSSTPVTNMVPFIEGTSIAIAGFGIGGRSWYVRNNGVFWSNSIISFSISYRIA